MAQIRDGESNGQFALRLAREEWQGQIYDEVENLFVSMFGEDSEITNLFISRLNSLRAERNRV